MTSKIGLVTGAATGIGAAVTRQLAEAGVRVAICDINDGQGEDLAREVSGKFIRCDVRSFEAMRAAVDECVQRLGVPDYAHLNAGVMTVPADQPFLGIEEVSIEQYRSIVSVNMDGVFFGLKALLPRMREKGGAITITASIAGLAPLPIDPLYGMTKHGMIGLGRGVAEANKERNLRVNVICPGMVDTAIIPDALRALEMKAMPPSEMAAEVVDLLFRGENGEVRVKLADRPSFRVDPPDLRARVEGELWDGHSPE